MQDRIYIDLETYGTADLKEVGVYKYAHQDVEILMANWAVNDGPLQTWEIGQPSPPSFQKGALYIAQNAAFERRVLHEAWGWPSDPENWHCTQAQALAHGYPGSLADLCRFIGLAEEDSKIKGEALIALFCMPHAGGKRYDRTTHPKEWADFVVYGGRDTIALREIHTRLPTMNFKGAELDLWRLDQKINDRGFAVDLELARVAIDACSGSKEKLDAMISELTHGAITSGTQRERILHWLAYLGVELPDLRKDTLARTAITDNDEAQIIINIRQQVSRSSTAKYERLLTGHVNGRMQHTLQFSGAGRTARWAGRRFQPHNLPRPTEDWETVFESIDALKLGAADLLYPDVHEVASNALRSAIVAENGKVLGVADWMAVEGRGLAWFAGEQWKLDAYAEGRDMYIETYARSFNVAPFEKKDPRRQTGKVLDLASGYAGGVGALLNMCRAYRINPAELAAGAWEAASRESRDSAYWMWSEWATKQDKTYDLDEDTYCGLEAAKFSWRAGSPATVRLWKNLHGAAVKAVQEPGQVFRVDKLAFTCRNGTLLMRLPSGRCLFYFKPKVAREIDKDGNPTKRMNLTTLDIRFGRQPLTPGLITENATQAMCRDILAGALIRVEKRGYPVVLHTHDEIVVEVPDFITYDDDPIHEEIAKIMVEGEPWSTGLPLAAEGFTGTRYRK